MNLCTCGKYEDNKIDVNHGNTIRLCKFVLIGELEKEVYIQQCHASCKNIKHRVYKLKNGSIGFLVPEIFKKTKRQPCRLRELLGEKETKCSLKKYGNM